MAGLTKVAAGGVADNAVTADSFADNSINGDHLNHSTALPDGVTATTQSASDDSTKVATTAYVDNAVGGISADKVTEGNTTVEVVDTGSDGHITFDTEGSEAMRVDSSQRLLLGVATAPTDTAGGLIQSVHSAGAQTVIGRNDSDVDDDDLIGRVGFTGFHNSSFKDSAAIEAAADADHAGNNRPGRLTFHTTGSSGNVTERMRIDSSGSVAIGDASQMGSNYARLSIDCDGRDAFSSLTDVTTYGLAFHNDATSNAANGIGFFNDNGANCGGFILHQDKGSNNLGDLVFGTSATSNSPQERMRIDSSGRLLVGTVSAIDTGSTSLIQASSTGGARIALARNDTETAANDSIGRLRWFGNDSDGNFDECARIDVIADSSHSNDSKPSSFTIHTTASSEASPTERVRIDSAGRLLVGTTSSSVNLRAVIQGNSSSATTQGILAIARGSDATAGARTLGSLYFTNNAHTIGAQIDCTTDEGWTGTTKPAFLTFSTNDGAANANTEERMRITSGGNVGIGTTSPSCELEVSGTGAVELPQGTNAQRPTGAAGMMRFNTDSGQFEYWSSTSTIPQWRRMDQRPSGGVDVHFLVVGGGGSGGRQHGAGGGAGGFRTSFGTGSINGRLSALDDQLSFTLNQAYSVIVGTGGVAQTTDGWTPGSDYGTNGGDSTLGSITSKGGGAGGPYHQTSTLRVGKDGGCGGGGSSNDGVGAEDNGGDGEAGQGFDGGGTVGGNSGGGGGGGAHANGNDASSGQGGHGGEGGETTIITTSMATSNSIGEVSGGTVYFSGGGGSGSYSGTRGNGGLGGGGQGGQGTSGADTGQESGSANTGGGGGGSSNLGSTAGNGGSGIVILRIPDAYSATFTSGCTVATDTSVSGVKIYMVKATSSSSETVTLSED